MSVQRGDLPRCSMRLAIISCLNGEEALDEKFRNCILKSSEMSAPVYLCILFNELSTCEWYLRTGKAVENQRKRLPNHDATRIRLESNKSQLNVRIILFEYEKEDRLHDTGVLSAEQVLSEFCDDQFLRVAVSQCKQLAQNYSFQLECFTVPCRNTVILLQVAAKIAEEAKTQFGGDESLLTPGALHRLAAVGGTSQLAQIPDSHLLSVLHHQHEAFPGRTPLLCAAAASVTGFCEGSEAHVEFAKMLISKGADPRATDSRRHSVLHCAVLSGNAALLSYLLERKLGVDINGTDNSSMTPLLLAVEEENSQLTEILLDNGATDQITDNSGCSALSMAVSAGNLDLVRILVKHKPQILLENNAKNYASIYWSAWKQGYQDICLFLLQEKFQLNEESISEAEKLNCLISQAKKKEFCKRVNSVNCNWRDWEGRTPLTVAASGGLRPSSKWLVKCAERLLQLNADVNASDLEGNTHLHLAASVGNLEVIKLLRRHGASLDKVNFCNATPLDVAEHKGQTAVRAVLEKSESPDVSADDAKPQVATPEQKGQCSKPDELATEQKSSENLPTRMSPSESSKRSRSEEKSVGYQISTSSQRKEKLFFIKTVRYAARKSQWEVVETLVKTAYDQKMKERCCIMAANFAAIKGQLDVVKFLVQTITDQRTRDQCCLRVSASAASKGQLDVVKFLVQTIAEQSTRDQCCLMAAASAASKGQLDMVKFLVQAISDKCMRDICCIETARLAATNGQLDVVKFLVQVVADKGRRYQLCMKAARYAARANQLEVMLASTRETIRNNFTPKVKNR
ncbi:hypothetical protein BOX15_Mlig031509g1 [Macrostomum lignano]|uniref:Uncharacterized protein n=1 Tax=Macrostomum lignano TaxID=282301 RepID=A0A267E9Z6_9PLAT|nr:hypothetical protein BOX15_Mlig031509g1 [Macrostomum lignano]